jgi:hypothetical protein
MNLTAITETWSNLQPQTRGIYSIVIAIIGYLLFRLLIYKLNKFAKEGTPTKVKGNYWERVKQNASTQLQ